MAFARTGRNDLKRQDAYGQLMLWNLFAIFSPKTQVFLRKSMMKAALRTASGSAGRQPRF
jgi:hypothetical protein